MLHRPSHLCTSIPPLRPLALAAACLFLPPAAQCGGAAALPGGLQVVQGQATLTSNGKLLTVNNSANALLNWQQFSIGAGQAVHFAQPDAASKVLNRVLGPDASAIFGSLSSNGQVWLLNPNGVLFGAGARVDVAGLVASTLRLGDADWRANRFTLAGSADGVFGAASVVNQGRLVTPAGGRVLLIGAGSVRNDGLIHAPDGQVLLAAGRSVELLDTALPHLAVRLTAPQGEVLNLGQLLAGSGRIDLQAAVVNQSGIVRADSLGSSAGGVVVLSASQGVTLGAASLTSASNTASNTASNSASNAATRPAPGAAGGQITVDAGAGANRVSGQLRATSASGSGGSVTLLGRQVGLLGSAGVDVSAHAGGGQVHIGGGLQGQDAAYRNADAVYMAPGSHVSADATGQGNGGQVVLWSNHASRVYGSLSARGGPLGGDGGFIETSGGWLDARPAALHTSAPAGRAGQWLLDPQSILITDDTSDNEIVVDGANFSSNSLGQATLGTATLLAALNANNNVTVSTSAQGADGHSDITVLNALLAPAPTAPVSLTLNAHGSIRLLNSTVRSTGAALSLKLDAGRLRNSFGGTIFLDNTRLDTQGGDIRMGGNSVACGANLGCLATDGSAVATASTAQPYGIGVSGSALLAGSGRITMAGTSVVNVGGENANEAIGVNLFNGSTLSARQIELTGRVDANADIYRSGVTVSGGAISASERLIINGTATSRIYHENSRPLGVDVQQQGELRIGVAGGAPALAPQMTLRGVSTDAARAPGTRGPPALPRAGVALRGAGATLVALGGAQVQISGESLSPNNDYGILAVGSVPGFIDASQASHLSLSSAANILLTGDLRAPEGGTLAMASVRTLAIEAATISGQASQVQLAGTALHIGVAGAPTRLVFGDSTQINISAREFRLGLPGNEVAGVAAAAAAQVQAAQPLQLNPPAALATLAAGGVISILADAVQLGASASVHSAATGDAISLRGLSAGPGVSSFINQGGANALSAPNGRWLLLAQDSDAVLLPFQPGALRAAFRQYAAGASDVLPAQAGNGFLFASSPVLSLAGDGPVSKVYDGSDRLDLGALGLAISGLRSAERLLGDASFASRNVAADQPLRLASAGAGHTVLTDDALPVYGYRVDGQRLRGSITQRPLALGAVSVADKIYDGSTVAAISGWALDGVLAGDQVQVLDNGATFAVAGVGAARPVTVLARGLAGRDAGNYFVPGLADGNLSRPGTASITPAGLQYRADPASAVRGQPLPALGGTVLGWVAGETLAGETLAGAITGVLRFATSATTDALPGRYPVQGSGLQAANYSFSQAPANAFALTLLAPPGPGELPALSPLDPTLAQAAIGAVLPPARPSTPDSGRALDVLQAVLPSSLADRPSFAMLDLDLLSAPAVATLLAARDAYKKALFGPALLLLESDPSLADASGCDTAQQAVSGQCLLIGPLAGGLSISHARVLERAPVAQPAPAVAGEPAPVPAGAALPPPAQPSPTQPSPARPAVLPPPALAVAVQLPGRRAIVQARLPQIQRKIALLIGIDRYADGRIPQLANAVADARAVAQALESRLGYETLVLDNASRATVFQALNQLVGAVGPADSVVLYYAGHGAVVDKTGQGYWQPADADPARPETWIANADIDRLLRQLPASQLAMISDSCFSGGLVSGERIRGVSASQDPGLLLGRRAAVVMSSGGNEPVADAGKNGHSPFAYSLIQSLQQLPDWKPGSSVFEQVRFAVARQLPQRPQYGAVRDAGHQPGADYLFERRQLQAVVK